MLALTSVALNCAPIFASSDATSNLDPAVAALLYKRTACGVKPGPVESPDPSFMTAQTPASGQAPVNWWTPTPTKAHTDRDLVAQAVAQADASASPNVQAPSGQSLSTNAPQPGSDTGDTPAPAQANQPTPTPNPSATPTQVPIPPVPPVGPQSLLPPTPRSTAAATPSPVPLPSATPSASASGPIYIVRPSGEPTVLPLKSPVPMSNETAAPTSSPTAAAGPSASPPAPLPTLGPYQIVTVADKIKGSSETNQPTDLFGNVHIFYVEGEVVGDRAHFDGDHTILLTGHTYLVNRNSDAILYADEIMFDTSTKHATLVNGQGETTEGVQQGKLHFSAQRLTTSTAGVAHGERASFTTCEHPHGGYHIEARTIDVMPGDRLVARKAVVFLGPTAVFYLPILIIPLRSIDDPRRQTSFLPVIGYDSVDGFFIKVKLSFAPSQTYFGYYRIEYFTRRGLGLGYTAFAGSKTGRRYVTVDAYTINDRSQGGRQTNFSLQEAENFSQRLRSLVGVVYQGDYGPNISLPASLNITGSLAHQGVASTENLTFSRYLQGSLSDNLNLGFVDSITLSKNLQQQINLAYTKFNSQLVSSNTLHINTDTHLFTKFADYDLIYDKTDYSSNPFGYDKLPELSVLPHIDYGGFRFGPQLRLTAGEYAEPQNHFATQRIQGQLNEAVYFKVLNTSDFSANYNLTQDYYGTGDLKGYDQQNATLTTPLVNHFVNAATYNEQHPFGPDNVPFQLLDRLSSGSHSAQDVIRYFNRDYVSFSLGDGTFFNRQAQAATYQLALRPSLRSYLTLGGFYSPGPGQGFGITNVQLITPFGRDTTLEFTTNIDWKNHDRLADKNIYLTRTIDQCYNLQFAYNQDLKTFNFNVVILAFPGQSAGFGFGGTQQYSGVLPQNFAF